ncbi:MAG: hypothetical protein ACM3UU_02575 [Ignavibacteriales bacterium]
MGSINRIIGNTHAYGSAVSRGVNSNGVRGAAENIENKLNHNSDKKILNYTYNASTGFNKNLYKQNNPSMEFIL